MPTGYIGQECDLGYSTQRPGGLRERIRQRYARQVEMRALERPQVVGAFVTAPALGRIGACKST